METNRNGGGTMKKRLALMTAIATLVAAIGTAFATTPAAQAQPQPSLAIPGTTCDVAGTPVACTLQLVGFSNRGGTLNAAFRLTNEVTGQVTRIFIPILQQPGNTCTILELETGDIDLFLLGLHLHIDPIHIILTAQRGTLLGDLLCGIFFGDATPGLLQQALRNGLLSAPA
jgi:hypothetical protein